MRLPPPPRLDAKVTGEILTPYFGDMAVCRKAFDVAAKTTSITMASSRQRFFLIYFNLSF
jgi:hypothetical protein